jgi:hypothetical protein
VIPLGKNWTTLELLAIRSFWHEAAIVLALAGLMFLVLLGSLIAQKAVFDIGPDQTHLLCPLFHYTAKCFSTGEYPYWAPAMFGGLPLYNTPQLSCQYPLYFLRNAHLDTPIAAALHVAQVTFFHVFVFLVNMYILLRVLRLGRAASFVGACLATFNPAVYCYLGWVHIIAPYSWLPLALAGIVLVMDDERPGLGVALTIVGSSLLTIASPSQPLIHLVYLGGILTLGMLLIRFRQRLSVWRPLRNLVLAGGMAFILSAPVLLPAYNMMRGAIRWVGVGGGIVGKQRIPFSAFTHDGWSIGELARVALPIKAHHEVGDIHLGVLALLLVGLSLFAVRRRPVLLLFWGMALYGLASCTATRLGLAYINYRLPLVNLIREPGRHLFVAHLCLCVLAAWGLQYLCDRLRQQSDKRGLSLTPYFVAVLGGLLALAAIQPRPYAADVSAAQVWLPALLFVALTGLFWLRGSRTAGIPLGVLLGILALIPTVFLKPTPAPYEGAACFEEDNLQQHDILKQLAALPDASEYRFGFHDERGYQRWCMNCLYYDLRTDHGYFNPLPYRQFSEIGFIHNRPNASRLFGMKYSLVKNGEPLPPGRTKQREFEGYTLYQAADAMPPWFLVNQVAGKYASPEQFFEKIEASQAYRSQVFVHEKDFDHVSGWLGNQQQPLQAKTRELGRTYNTRLVWCSTPSTAMFVLNEYGNRAWQLCVDGRREVPLVVNQFQMGVLLPPGKHVLRFVYEPQRFEWLLWLQRGVIAAGVAAVGLVVISKRRPAQPVSGATGSPGGAA